MYLRCIIYTDMCTWGQASWWFWTVMMVLSLTMHDRTVGVVPLFGDEATNGVLMVERVNWLVPPLLI